MILTTEAAVGDVKEDEPPQGGMPGGMGGMGYM